MTSKFFNMLTLLVIFFTFVSAMIVYREMNSLIAQDMVSKENVALMKSMRLNGMIYSTVKLVLLFYVARRAFVGNKKTTAPRLPQRRL